jgi:hypothetical protein
MCVCTYIPFLILLVQISKKEHACVHQYTAGFNNINLLFVMDVNISLLMSTTSFSINKRATFIST